MWLLPLDSHLSRLHRFHLREVNGEHAVFALGFNPSGVDRFVDLKDAEEVAFLVLTEQHLAAVLRALRPGLQDKLASFEPQLDILGLDAGYIGIKCQLVVCFINVDAGLEKGAAASSLSALGIGLIGL